MPGPLRASNPIRFDIGGHRGAGGPPGGDEAGEEAHLLQVRQEHIQRLIDCIERLHQDQRERRATMHTEWAYVASGNRAELGPLTQDQFRVTYIWAYAGAAATLQLKGGLSGATLALPIPTGPSVLNLVLGDEETGGIILERRDLRFITTNDASSQLLVAFLAGEILSDSYLS